MPDPFATLDLPPDADDEAIRRRYLELTRRFTPEHHPERFAAVRAAYERVKDVGRRARFRLFEAGKDDTIESVIEEVSCRTPRRWIGLQALLASQSPPPPR